MKSVSPQAFCARKLKVLADNTRLAVLELLMEEPKHVGELNAVLQVEQSLLSHHLKVLRDEGFVRATRDGKAVLYSLCPGVGQINAGKAIDLGCCLLSFEQAVKASLNHKDAKDTKKKER
ncbi:MAG: metalloregulator ArsR/SmtB family transcription factor [Aphanothece sp. CMT-3BRIN-NPC111]|nr:metalloregulator ArsR/SmtB family transcription factor [Aphanothece sp. CMT-3BRIN-NPC111]